MDHLLLSDDEVNFLIEKTESLIKENKISQAQLCLNQIIETTAPKSDYVFLLRASTYSSLGNWQDAINDIRQAIKLNPDDSSNYMNLGANLTFQLFQSKPHRLCDHRTIIEEILDLYTECLKRDPANKIAWFNSAETHLFLRQWDDAIAIYAQCRPYVTDISSQITHAWLGCLAFALCGDAILKEDSQLLYDQSIRFPEDFHDTSQIDYLLAELQDDGFDPDKLAQARHIHEEFLNHFDDQDHD